MIPKTSITINNANTLKTLPSKNYNMDFTSKTIFEFNDELLAMKQVVFKILNTERYSFPIYSQNFGVELQDLFGEPVSYIIPELERRIKEALLQDDRIEAVDSFEFNVSKKSQIILTFIVHSIYGDLKEEREVAI